MRNIGLLFALCCPATLLGGCDDAEMSSASDSSEGETEAPGETEQEECSGEAPEACLEGCGSDIIVADPVCSGGAWVCEDGVSADECGPSCEGEAPQCTEGCDIELGPASCIEGGWFCEEGVLAEECVDACGDDPPLCAADCSDPAGPGEPVEANCETGAWICGDFAPEDCEPVVCEDEDDDGAACLEACGSDIIVADPVCGECAEGVHSDSCGSLCEGRPGACVAECGGEELDPQVCSKVGWECLEGIPAQECE